MPYTLLSDEELFEKVKADSDEQAFRTLFRRYDKRLYAYCLRALGDHEEAQDMFQTIALTVFDKRESFKEGSFAAWLFTITRNFCLKALRGRKHTTELTDDMIQTNDEASHIKGDVFMREALQNAISKLPVEFREALELKYFDDLPYEEIADVLGITVSLAKVRVFRAKKMIQTMMSPILKELQ